VGTPARWLAHGVNRIVAAVKKTRAHTEEAAGDGVHKATPTPPSRPSSLAATPDSTRSRLPRRSLTAWVSPSPLRDGDGTVGVERGDHRGDGP